jgi:hypothetical protein
MQQGAPFRATKLSEAELFRHSVSVCNYQVDFRHLFGHTTYYFLRCCYCDSLFLFFC